MLKFAALLLACQSQAFGVGSVSPALDAFYAFVGDADILVAHNARFDTSFVAAQARRHGRAVRPQPALDTVELARKIVPGLESYSLNKLAANLGVETGRHHRGLSDSFMAEYGDVSYYELRDAVRAEVLGGGKAAAGGAAPVPRAAPPAPPQPVVLPPCSAGPASRRDRCRRRLRRLSGF